jgi:hypothetical protein
MRERRRQGESLSAHRGALRTVRRLVMALLVLTCILVGPATGSAAAQAPVNNLAPEVVGNALVGERLVCGAGSWTGTVSEFTYEWLRDAIHVASGLTYGVTTADRGHSLWCVVTAIGSGGRAEAESSNSLAIPGGKSEPPLNIAPPEVSGKPAVGETLNCSTGTWTGNPAPTFTYQWLREGSIIASATSSTYVVVEADQGHPLSCKVTATNSAASASKPSSNSLPVPGTKPEGKVAPQVLGIEPSAVGEALTCSPGTWGGKPAPTFAYRWVRDRGLPDETIIESATGSTYTIGLVDQLYSLSCEVIATNNVGSSEAASSNSLRVGGSKPENTAPPEVSGTPAIAGTLTCETGTWTGVPTPTYAYLWVRDQGLPGEEAIGSATSQTYTVRIEDRGHSLSCDVTATNSGGSASQTSERVVVAAGTAGRPPQNEVAPEVSGKPAVAETLTCSGGTWSGSPAPTFTYQWLRDGSIIASATSSSYVVLDADQGHSLSCKVTAINEEGVAAQNSGNVLEIPGREPENIEAPLLTGTPAVGRQLTCLRGKWNGQPPPTFTYQWLRGGTIIASATASSYIVASEDRGKSITCRVIAQNSAGTVEAISSNSLEIPGGQPENTGSPEVSGTPAVGNTLTCSPGTWNGQPTPTYTYQWLLEGIAIPSATTNTYTITTADRGLVLSCKVTASNREGTESASSKGLHVPGKRPEDIEAPQVSGTPAVGQRLTCLRGIWNAAPPPAFTYQWLRDGTSIASATGSTYTVELADQGHLLSCDVTATNSEGRAEAGSSNGIAILRGTVRTESTPELTFSPPPDPPTATAVQILAALHVQLARVQHRVRIASLRKTGLYTFSFAAPAAGKLEFSWYQTSQGAHNFFASSKPLLLALCTKSFASAGSKIVKLRLTSAGRGLIGHSKRIPLTVKGVFVTPRGGPVTWLQTVLLSH